MSREVIEIWNAIKDQVSVSKEEFLNKVEELRRRIKLNDRALAILAANQFGADTKDLLHPPIIGRVLYVSPVRLTVEGVPYRLFTLVDENRRYFCVAFGEENISKLDNSEDKVVKISRYVETRLGGEKAFRAAESSKVEILPDDALPPITRLKPAWAPLAKAIKSKGYRLARFAVIDEQTSEYLACPVCGRSLETRDSDLYCPEHGLIREPDSRKVFRYKVADESGIFSAVFFGEPPESLTGKLVTAKGYGREDDFHIIKIYEIENI